MDNPDEVLEEWDHVVDHVLGKNYYKNVLYTDDHYVSDEEYSNNPLLTSDSPSVEEAKQAARKETHETGIPHVAIPIPPTSPDSNARYSFRTVSFSSSRVTNDTRPEVESVLRAMVHSDNYTVTVEPNYRTGTVVVKIAED